MYAFTQIPRRPRGRSPRHTSLSIGKGMLIILRSRCRLLMIQISMHMHRLSPDWDLPGIFTQWLTDYAHYNKDKLNAISISTLYSSHVMPSTSLLKQNSLRKRTSCRCFTIKKACSGGGGMTPCAPLEVF